MLVYAPSLGGDPVYEDVPNGIFPSDQWQGWRTELAGLWHGTPYSATAVLYNGVGHVTAMSHRAQRVVSLGGHLLVGLMVWTVARRILPPLGAFVAAGVFLLHPVQTESVAYVAARSEIVVAVAVCLALLAAERGWWPVAWLLAAGAVLGKPTGILGMALVPIWAMWRGIPTWRRVSIGWGLAGLVPLVAGGLYVARRELLVASVPMMGETLTAWTRLLLLWVAPWGQTIDHPWVAFPTVAVVATLALWALGLLTVRRPWVALTVAWCGVIVLPRMVWQLGEGVHEHHLYLATPVLSLGLGRLVGGPWRAQVAR